MGGAVKKSAPAQRSRKRYEPPRLVRYGDVAQLTQNRLRGPRKDNGKAFKTRTR
jgi:hypothetical protein